MNRRQFVWSALASGVTVSSVGIASSVKAAPSFATLASDVNSLKVSHVLVDKRFPAAQAFAEAMQSRGLMVFDTQADSIQLSYSQPAAFDVVQNKQIVGLTTQSDFEVIRDLLRKKGMVLQHEILHQCLNDYSIEHRAISECSVATAGELSTSMENWPLSLVEKVLVNKSDSGSESVDRSFPIAFDQEKIKPVTLVSWVFS